MDDKISSQTAATLLANELLPLLNWKDAKIGKSPQDWVTITAVDGKRINIHGWSNEDTLHVWGRYFDLNSPSEVLGSGAAAPPRANVSKTRSPIKAAADIYRRFVPLYESLWNEVNAQLNKNHSDTRALCVLFEELKSCYPKLCLDPDGEESVRRKTGYKVSFNDGHKYVTDAFIRLDEEGNAQVRLHLSNLDMHQAQRICLMLAHDE